MNIWFNEYMKPTEEKPNTYGYCSVRYDKTNNFIVFHNNECGLTSTVMLSVDEVLAAANAIITHFAPKKDQQ